MPAFQPSGPSKPRVSSSCLGPCCPQCPQVTAHTGPRMTTLWGAALFALCEGKPCLTDAEAQERWGHMHAGVSDPGS